jgi:hypothetical protein
MRHCTVARWAIILHTPVCACVCEREYVLYVQDHISGMFWQHKCFDVCICVRVYACTCTSLHVRYVLADKYFYVCACVCEREYVLYLQDHISGMFPRGSVLMYVYVCECTHAHVYHYISGMFSRGSGLIYVKVF